MGLSDIIDVQISIESAAIVAAGFGVPLILGTHTRFAERYREYESVADMLEAPDAFLATDAEYLSAVALMSQTNTVERFLVGRRAAAVAQVTDIVIDTVTSSVAQVFDGLVAYAGAGTVVATINGVAISVATDTDTATTRAALVAAINASTNPLVTPVTAANGAAGAYTLTADVPGVAFTAVATQTGGQTHTLTQLTANVDASYTFSITDALEGLIVITYRADATALVAEIQAGLIAAVLASDAPVTASASGDDVRLTADDPGVPFTVTEADAKLSVETSVANVGVQADLDAIVDAGAAWYATLLTSRDGDQILQAAAWTEANSADQAHILIAQVSTAAVRTAAYDSGDLTTDVASRLKGLSYTRTTLWWHALDAEYLDAAVAGKMLPTDPGTETWALKDLVGVTVDVHTTTQKNNVTGSTPGAGKNGNVYYQLTANNNITWRGTMASGDWIDLIRYVDSAKARISERIAALLLTQSKIPMTDAGINSIAHQVRGVLQEDEDAGKLTTDPKYTVTAPRASAVSQANREARILSPAIAFAAQTSGAIHEASVRGKVTQ
jgi:hypothetical protein